MAPGTDETCTALYTTTAADVSAGKVTNTATATGTTPSGTQVTDTKALTIPLAAIALLKTASIESFTAAGTPITYTYKLTNTGTAP